jgi:hypothetical protein
LKKKRLVSERRDEIWVLQNTGAVRRCSARDSKNTTIDSVRRTNLEVVTLQIKGANDVSEGSKTETCVYTSDAFVHTYNTHSWILEWR